MRTLFSRLAVSVCLSLLAPLSHAQGLSVWVVDDSGGADFTEIADALLVTHAGWTVLVRPGTYTEPVTLTNQACSIVADGTGPVVLTERVVIEDLGPGRDVTLSGLELQRGFVARDCEGLVVLQGCTTLNPPIGTEIPPGTMYHDWNDCGIGVSRHEIKRCDNVTLVDCEFHGALGDILVIDALPGQHALGVEDSEVALYHCTLIGGDGQDGPCGHCASLGAAGGDGLHFEDADSVARLHEVSLVGGTGGDGFVQGDHGCDGAPFRHPQPRNVVTSTHPTFAFRAPAVMAGGQAVTLEIDGVPGTPVSLIQSAEGDWRSFPANFGILHLALPAQLTPLGMIPGSGTLVSTFVPGTPQQPTEFISLHLQILGLAQGTRFLSEPRRVVAVDPSL